MPYVSVDHFAGLDPAARRKLQERLAGAVIDTLGSNPASVRVYTRAVDPADVYCADGEHQTGLPVVRAEFLSGRPVELKHAFIAALARAAAESVAVPIDQVRTILYEKDRDLWGHGVTPMSQWR